MGTLNIRNLDDAVKWQLRMRAAARGVSMERYARDLIANSIRSTRRTLSVDEILAFGMKPKKDFDQKKISDALYSYLEDE
jgi:antitoxin FitA